MNDAFSLPEACLLADTVQFFIERQIQFDAVKPNFPLFPPLSQIYSFFLFFLVEIKSNVFDDVRDSVNMLHKTRKMHEEIESNLEKYLEKDEGLCTVFDNFRRVGKKLFLISNSPFHFIEEGMKFLTANTLPSGISHWTLLFDYIICEARKPTFYEDHNQFRCKKKHFSSCFLSDFSFNTGLHCLKKRA